MNASNKQKLIICKARQACGRQIKIKRTCKFKFKFDYKIMN